MAAHPETVFPNPPWRLRGRAFAAAWFSRALDPALAVPADWQPLAIGGRRLIGAIWADWRPGGDLAYHELAVGLVVRRGPALAVTLPWIWVDSETSRAGGRALWAIPKDLAGFAPQETGFSAQTPLGPASVAPGAGGLRLGRRSFGFATAQPDGRRTVMARARITAELAFTRDAWRLPPPLDRLGAPFMTARLEDAELVFGD